MSIYGWKSEREARRHVQVYGAYQELFDHAKQDGIEAIVLALPLHLHAPVAVAAMRQGLHVLTEKLMAQKVYACKEMARVAQQTGRCLAIGHQRHYNILYWEAVDIDKARHAGRYPLHPPPMEPQQSARPIRTVGRCRCRRTPR